MKKVSVKMALWGTLSLFVFGTVATSCSKDDDKEINIEKNSYKITVTLNNVDPERDYVSITAAGSTINGKSDVWKVNGVVRTGESAIGLNKNDFSGSTKTYVIETTEPVAAIAAGVQIINYGADLPMSFKIEQAGKEKVNENLTLSGDGKDFSKQYSF